MMRFLIGLMLLVVALAGCADTDSFVPEEADQCLVQAADDFSCDELPVGSPDEVAHVHDYWQGQEEMTIMDFQLDSGRIGAGTISSCTAWPWYELTPDDGFTVIQGTSEVKITMDWDDEPYDLYRDPELWVKTASMNEPEFVKSITPGEVVTIDVETNDDNDLPHNLLSAWQFVWAIYPEDPNDPLCDIHHWSGFRAQVEIVKGLDIPVFPAHPDHWDDGNITDIQVQYEEAVINYYESDGPGGGTCLGGTRCLWDPWLLDDGSIVPYDTETVIVDVDVRPEYPDMRLGFAYHGADTRELTLMEPTRTEGTVQTYEIDVSRIQADGPYNIQSLWEFWLYPLEGDVPDGEAPGHDPAFAGDITMTVTVHKDAD